MKLGIIIFGWIVIFLNIYQVESTKKKVALESKDTSPINYIGLLFRIIFGVASLMGWGESLPSVFRPPESDYDDYDDELIPGIF